MKKKYSKETEELINNMNLMDDYLMSRVFDENIPATQLMLQIILNEEVEVVATKGQWDIKSSLKKGRGVRLDVYAKDSKGRYFDCEVQNENEGAHPKRARYNSSMLDSRMLNENQDFKDLKDSYVIFITKKDYFNENEPVYRIVRNLESGKAFDDGSHIIYVNGQYYGDDALGHLLADMNNRSVDGFYYQELQEGVKHYKIDQEGRNIMYETVEEFVEKIYDDGKSDGRSEGHSEGHSEGIVASVRALMKNMKLSAEQAMDTLDIPKNERNKYMTML